MFLHRTSLPALLRPVDYTTEAALDAERATVFRDAWRYVAPAKHLARAGDQFGLTVDGVPVVVRNVDGVLRAFKNVCAHRHSTIVRDGASHAATLQCQYHGWEYDPTGRLAKVPDGRSFKGIERARLCLETYRVDTFAHVVFVNLAPGTGTFRDALGELAPDFDRYYSDRVLWGHAEARRDGNWKIVCENAVESYHVPMVHSGTFGDYRDETFHDHRLGPNYTSYLDKEPPGSDWRARAHRLATRLTLPNATFQRFTHAHVFPNLLFFYADLVADMIVVEPIDAGHTRQIFHLYAPARLRFPLLQRPLLQAFMNRYVKSGAGIVEEDAAVYANVHRGMMHSPHAGVLSAREERVYHFQRWIAQRLGRDVP